MPPEQNDSRAPGDGSAKNRPGGKNDSSLPSWLIWVLVLVIGVTVISALSLSSKKTNEIPFTKFTKDISAGNVKKVTWNNVDATITGELKSGQTFMTTGPKDPPPDLLT